MIDHPQVNLTADDFNSSAAVFSNLGTGFGDFVNDLNYFTATSMQENNSAIVPTGQLFEEMSLFYFILDVSTIRLSYS
jgi:hypothetical protein